MARKTIKILYICHLENFTQHKIKAMATDDTLNNENQTSPVTDYNEGDIKTLDWKEHIRKRPGMYIGKLGDGTNSDDGIYVLLKEVLDNSIDEYMMGFGKQIIVEVTETSVKVRDYGRGVPLGKACAKIVSGVRLARDSVLVIGQNICLCPLDQAAIPSS